MNTTTFIAIIIIAIIALLFLFVKRVTPEEKVQKLIEKANKLCYSTDTYRLAGVKYCGPQALRTLKEAECGDFVELAAEPENKYDEYAVKVKLDEVNIGYIPRESSFNVFHALQFVEYAKLIDFAMIEGDPFVMIEVVIKAPTGLTDEEFSFVAEYSPERLKELKDAAYHRDMD